MSNLKSFNMFQSDDKKDKNKIMKIKLALPKINMHSLELDIKQEDESLNIKNLKLLKEIYKFHEKVSLKNEKNRIFK